MSYNTRRGNIAFNKNISASSVGQRRPIVTNNYIQQNQSTAQRHQATQPLSQLQLAKQQPMLVQRKQQLAQQQKQQQQKQQLVQQKLQLANKQQQEQLVQQKKELDLKKQRDLEIQKQKELEQQKQIELEQQKQIALEQQKQQELEQQLELQKQELEVLKKRELELQMQSEIKQEHELQKQRELGFQNNEKLQQPNSVMKEMNQQQVGSEPMVVEDQKLTLPVLREKEIMENISENRPERRKRTTRRKLSKYEIKRRRNFKLGKLLQPKSAMVVLNEVVKNLTYNLDNFKSDGGSKYRATVVVDGVEHEGIGISKAGAKNNAAENAMKYLVKHKKLIQLAKPKSNTTKEAEVEDEAMDTSDKEENEIPLAWQQFASYAVYKLLASWGEDPNSIREEGIVTKKPSKKIPNNANLMNPLMLLYQMLPQAHFEELPSSKSGNTFTYNFKCTVDNQTFMGTGKSKKLAKKQAAFEACRNILGIEYPPEIYTPPIPTSA